MIVESKPVKSNFTGTREKETKKTRKTPVPKKFDLTSSFKLSNKKTQTKGSDTSPHPHAYQYSLSVKSGENHFKMTHANLTGRQSPPRPRRSRDQVLLRQHADQINDVILRLVEDVIVATLPPPERRPEWRNQQALARQTTHTPFTVCKSLGAKVRYNDRSWGYPCGKSGYNYILRDGEPLGWSGEDGRCFPKALMSFGIQKCGQRYIYIGVKGDICYLEEDGGTKKRSSGGFSSKTRTPIIGIFM